MDSTEQTSTAAHRTRAACAAHYEAQVAEARAGRDPVPDATGRGARTLLVVLVAALNDIATLDALLAVVLDGASGELGDVALAYAKRQVAQVPG